MSVTKKQLADALKACARVLDPSIISTTHEHNTALSDARVLSDEFDREVRRCKERSKLCRICEKAPKVPGSDRCASDECIPY